MLFERSYQILGGSTSGGPQRKRGLGRVWELIMDNTARFLVSNLICILCALPCVLGILYALGENSLLMLILAGLVGGMIFGPSYGALSDGVLLAVRDLPGEWWRKYRHAWKMSWKDSLIPGGVLGCLVSLMTYEYYQVDYGIELPGSMYACTLVAIVVLVAFFTYLWPQLVFTDLKLRQILPNCLMMLLAHPLVSLASILVQLAYWGLLLWFFPMTGILIPITGAWLPSLLGLMIVYNQLNRDFKIEARQFGGQAEEETLPEHGEG